MTRFLPLLMVAALTGCGPSQPTETVDFLVAHPERLKEVQRLCKEDRAKAGEELCRRAAKPPTGVSSAIGRNSNPNSAPRRRLAATEFLLLPHHAAARSRMRHFIAFATARSLAILA